MTRHLAIVAALVLGCGYDSPLVSVVFKFQVQGLQVDPTTQSPRVPHAPLTFQTGVVPNSGEIPWTVTLTTAQVALGPVYFYNAPAYATTETVEGRVVSEVLATFDVDALDPTPVATTPGGVGDNEPVLSVSIWLTEDQTGPIASAAGPGEAVMLAVGTAQRTIQQGGMSVMQMVPFDGLLELPSNLTDYANYLAHHPGQFQVNPNDVTSGFTPANGGTLTLQVDPTHWFDGIDFEQLVSGSATPYGFSNITQALDTTVLQPATFTFTWTPPHP